MSDFSNCSQEELNTGIAAQSSRIRLEAIKWDALTNPYANLIDGGTQEAHTGAVITTVVPERVVLNQSMTVPDTVLKTALCGRTGPQAEYGMTQYTTQMRALDGKGPLLCVHQAFHLVERGLVTMETGLKNAVRDLSMADIRAQMLILSGLKFVMTATGSPLDYITGGENQIQVDFEGSNPSAELTHQALVNLRNLMLEELNVEPFGTGDGAYAAFIGSSGIIEKMRNESGLKTETLAFVGGSDAAAKAALRRYTFAQYPYRGIRTAIDPKPLRFNEVDGNGFPILIEPYVEVATDHGSGWRTNPDWRKGGGEVGFLVFANALRRIVPGRYSGEGEAKFPPQHSMGELKWVNPQTLECNVWQDYGQFVFRIIRAFEGIMPYAICPILYRRCREDWGQNPCTGISEAED
ncbi:hypothetical protein [Thiocapsa sp. N5-Cardenillas]|uniref:hypothetical protein n=1 Tax=Thiocapsa sp. N5-Cardenillas TaxID=3137397 RepID=UPI0035B26971